ncbi:TPA: hypothetical protein ACIB1G_002654 [Salmonella enterica subsp. enterica serovar Saintpaul]
MFKNGQLVRSIIYKKYYVALYHGGEHLLVKELHSDRFGWIRPDFIELIGNNYTAKDSKESAPANLGF